MSHYDDYKAGRAREFISKCEADGLIFTIHDDELCITFTEAACCAISMSDFSSKLRWLSDEITEIVARRGRGAHLKLVKNGKRE